MAKALDVAKFLIRLAAAEEEPELLSPMRLQKLLYYVQGWSLGIRQTEMFGESIEAWQHGPVVREIYIAFSEFGSQPITADFAGDALRSLSGSDREFIESVWSGYRRYSTSGLRDMTHREPPWLEAWRQSAPTARDGIEISQVSMQRYFAARNTSELGQMFDPERLARAECEFAEGGGVDLEVFAESLCG